MNGRIGRILELLQDDGSWRAVPQLLSLADGALHAFAARRQDDFRAVSLREFAALDAHRLGHRQNDFVATNCADKRQADARVAAGRFDDGAALAENAFLLGIENHTEGNAVLDAATRIEELHFRDDVRFQVAIRSKGAELYQRRLADELGDCVVNSHNVFLFIY